ncbi:MAG: hypothetical protein IT281_11060 [Ignavibacteria bacterium]|nr:hypothetical protein [Ignavibacteria bacterium]
MVFRFRWYFTDTNRHAANQFLEQPHNGKGTFLIRPSDTCKGKIKMERKIIFEYIYLSFL